MASFFDHYDNWTADCREELREKGICEEGIERAEICENGQVHFHRSFYDISGPGLVTPWNKSRWWRAS